MLHSLGDELQNAKGQLPDLFRTCGSASDEITDAVSSDCAMGGGGGHMCGAGAGAERADKDARCGVCAAPRRAGAGAACCTAGAGGRESTGGGLSRVRGGARGRESRGQGDKTGHYVGTGGGSMDTVCVGEHKRPAVL